MTIQDWGALGEILGAIAVLITLVYLAVQTRINTNQLEKIAQSNSAQFNQSVVETWNDFRKYIVSDPDVATVYTLGLNDIDQLSDVDRVRFGFLMATILFSGWQHFELEKQELIPPVNRNLYIDWLKHPGC